MKRELFKRTIQAPLQLHSIWALVGLRDVLRAPPAILMCLSFEEHSLVHFSSDMCRTQSYFIYIPTQLLPLEEGFSRFPISKAHHITPGYAHLPITSLYPFIILYFLCSIFQLPFHYVLCLFPSGNTVYCSRSSFTEPAAPTSCSLLQPRVCQGRTM